MNEALTTNRLNWVAIARIASQKLGRKYSANYCREVATRFRSSAPLEPILCELGVMKEMPPSNTLPSPSAVVYPAADAESLERLQHDIKASLDEQVRLLAQRRRLATHLHAALKKRHLAEGMVSMMNDQVRKARASELAAAQRAERSMQMQASLQADLDRACSDRSAAITRAVAAEARSAQAERMLAQVLNAQRPTLSSRLRSLLLPQTPEVSA